MDIVNGSKHIVVAQPKLDLTTILSQSDDILRLKMQMKLGVHYGPPYPGSDKPTLLKPGAEWLARRFGLRPEFTALDERVELNYERPWLSFIMYRYRCRMIDIESDSIVGEAIGSCNSWEDKYHWRWVEERNIPVGMDKNTLTSKSGTLVEFAFAVERPETSGKYGKPMEYWKQFQDAIAAGTARKIQRDTKKGKSDAWEIGGTMYRVPSENPLDQLNTIDKMAQKRGFVSSVLIGTGASPYFAPGDDAVSDIYVDEVEGSDVIDAVFVEVPNTPAAVTSGKPTQPPPADVADWYASETTRRAFLELMRKEIANPSWTWEAVIAECERLSPGFKKMGTGKEAHAAIKAAFESEQLGKAQSKPAPAQPAVAFDVTALDAWVQQSFDLHLDELPELLKVTEAWTTFQTLEAAQARIRAAAHATRTPVIASSVTMKQLGKGRQMVFHTALGDISIPGGRGEVAKKLGTQGEAYGSLVGWTDWKDGSTYQLEGASLMVTWNEVENRLTVTGLKLRTPIQPAAKPAPFSGLDEDVDARNAASENKQAAAEHELTEAEAESIPF